MAYQVIWEKSQGTLQGSLPVVVQCSTLETITILSLYRDGTVVNLTGKTITATATDSDDNTTALTGTFTGAATYFTWEFSAGDVGTAGEYTVIFTYTDGAATWGSDPVLFIVRPNPAADTAQNPALVGIPASDAAWVSVSADGGALGTAAYVDTIDEDDMVSDSATHVPTQQSVKAYVDANGGGASDVGDLTTTGLNLLVFAMLLILIIHSLFSFLSNFIAQQSGKI